MHQPSQLQVTNATALHRAGSARGWTFSPNYAAYPDLTGSSSYRMPCPTR